MPYTRKFLYSAESKGKKPTPNNYPYAPLEPSFDDDGKRASKQNYNPEGAPRKGLWERFMDWKKGPSKSQEAPKEVPQAKTPNFLQRAGRAISSAWEKRPRLFRFGDKRESSGRPPLEGHWVGTPPPRESEAHPGQLYRDETNRVGIKRWDSGNLKPVPKQKDIKKVYSDPHPELDPIQEPDAPPENKAYRSSNGGIQYAQPVRQGNIFKGEALTTPKAGRLPIRLAHEGYRHMPTDQDPYDELARVTPPKREFPDLKPHNEWDLPKTRSSYGVGNFVPKPRESRPPQEQIVPELPPRRPSLPDARAKIRAGYDMREAPYPNLGERPSFINPKLDYSFGKIGGQAFTDRRGGPEKFLPGITKPYNKMTLNEKRAYAKVQGHLDKYGAEGNQVNLDKEERKKIRYGTTKKFGNEGQDDVYMGKISRALAQEYDDAAERNRLQAETWDAHNYENERWKEKHKNPPLKSIPEPRIAADDQGKNARYKKFQQSSSGSESCSDDEEEAPTVLWGVQKKLPKHQEV
jgi:hypothetical protein